MRRAASTALPSAVGGNRVGLVFGLVLEWKQAAQVTRRLPPLGSGRLQVGRRLGMLALPYGAGTGGGDRAGRGDAGMDRTALPVAAMWLPSRSESVEARRNSRALAR